MISSGAPSPSGLSEAFACLDLNGSADADTLTAAYRAAIKASHPDRPGGDAERFRCVIAAYRLIQAQDVSRLALAAPHETPAPAPVVALTPIQAFGGARVAVRIGARRLSVTVPAGVRTGQHLRLDSASAEGRDLYLPVLIRPADGLSVMGDDMFMRWPVSPRTLADGGRVEIDTHAGPQSAWVAPGMQGPFRLRLKNLGLPARGARPRGHLFVTLDASSDAPSAAEDLLIRFTRVWTPERLAA